MLLVVLEELSAGIDKLIRFGSGDGGGGHITTPNFSDCIIVVVPCFCFCRTIIYIASNNYQVGKQIITGTIYFATRCLE